MLVASEPTACQSPAAASWVLPLAAVPRPDSCGCAAQPDEGEPQSIEFVRLLNTALVAQPELVQPALFVLHWRILLAPSGALQPTPNTNTSNGLIMSSSETLRSLCFPPQLFQFRVGLMVNTSIFMVLSPVSM